MVSRLNKSSNQRFWGCAKFPTCKGTRNTDGDAPRTYGTEEEKDLDSWMPSDDWRGRDKRRWQS